ncbi:hypothetical protein DL98DRAFT_622456 [Cadophora sp. DSE1049]|nr:hypothetical protein DL98DRAFT_622456 [Cadophora sp. DSE1049]
MELFQLLFSIGALCVVLGQDLSTLPACGQTCVTNMLALAPSLGCSATDAACLCGNVNLAYGVRDCANEACSSSDAPVVIDFIDSYCADGSSSTESSATSSVTSVTSRTSSSTTSARESSSTSTTPATTTTPSSSSSTSSRLPSPTSPATESATSSSESSSGVSSIPPSTETTTPSTSSSSSQALSTGAKAGIGAGVGVGVLILCVLIYIMFLLKRSHNSQRYAPREPAQPGLPELGPGLTPEMETVERPGELDGNETTDWKDSLLFWRREKGVTIMKGRGKIGSGVCGALQRKKHFAMSEARTSIDSHSPLEEDRNRLI